ncbi:sunset domain-containing protein [Saccharothrix variisporea]|uniref:Uncharacterized protein n=1 Tax=Saccharothrix variisporea TaxID=543527 RepID=A0A495XB50_9PSEU|nr:hypothetical protein [Saccharothrix variisporea]RKT68748.1 hypothetical protein DFJ66_1941 [Saccharothrix variisporea]
MFWLFAQMFVLCGFAFLAGAVLTWLPLRATIRSLRTELTLARPTSRPALPAATVIIPTQPQPVLDPEPQPVSGSGWGSEPGSGSEPLSVPEVGSELESALESALEVAPEAALVPAPETAASKTAVPETAPPAGAEPAVVVVKGSSKSMIFHTPDSPYFKRMKGDVTFRSIAEAEEAGYTQWRPKTAAAQAR